MKCEDDETLSTTFSNLEYINLKLYAPYYVLLITFVLAHYILTSSNYQNLMEKYINREMRLQEKAKKNLANSFMDHSYNDVPEVSLDHEMNESSNFLFPNSPSPAN